MRRIAVFTGTRAEYGLLYWLIKGIQDDPELELQLIVSGTHLSPEFGETWKQIEEDGFPIAAKVEMLLSSDTPVGIAKSMGVGTIGFADALNSISPDCLVLLGDRFEALAIAQTAMVMQIPIAHMHGGELTEGLIDEAVRHSLTKMSQLHFTATEAYRNRVIQLGEQPDRVFNVGASSVENIRRLELIEREALEGSLDFHLGEKYLLVTYHPVTLERDGGVKAFGNLLSCLRQMADDYKFVITYPNADTYGRSVLYKLDQFVADNPDGVLLKKSLGRIRYLSAMRFCSAVVGNSSSGLLEAPVMGVPTVNIGDRQRGRIKVGSIIDCDGSQQGISKALQQAVSVEFQDMCKTGKHPYGKGYTSSKIIDCLKNFDLTSLLEKRFFDIDTSNTTLSGSDTL